MKIKQKLKIKGKDVPVFIKGEDPGVIATQIVEIPDNYTPMDISQLLDCKQKMINDNIEIIDEEVKDE